MKNKFKFLILILFILITTTGCTLNYNLTINTDRSILEEVSVTDSNNVLVKKYGDYKKKIKDEQFFYKDHQVYGDYSSNKIYKSDYSGLELSKLYPYGTYNDSPNKSSVFNSYAFYDEDGYYILRLTYPVKESIFPDTVDDENDRIDEAFLNIKSYFKVVDSNSDSYDEKTKTYTWKLDDEFFDNEEGVYIKLSTEQDNMLIFKDFINNNKGILTVIFVSVLVIAIAVLYVFRKYKNGMRV